MSRKAKYATYSQYEPYINVVMKELGLTGKVKLEWRFRHWKRKGGSAILYKHTLADGTRSGIVDISNRNGHAFTLTTILHELRHIQQMLLGRLELGFSKTEKTKRGKIKTILMAKWDGELMVFHRLTRKAETAEYYTDPWEVDAYAYGTDAESAKLFPKGKLQHNYRTFVGTIGNSKYYKVNKD